MRGGLTVLVVAACVVFTTKPSITFASANGIKERNETEGKLVETVLAALNNNYSTIKAARGLFETKMERTGKSVVESTGANILENGARLILPPQGNNGGFVQTRTFAISGNRLRSELRGGEGQIEEVLIGMDGKFTVHTPGTKDAWIRALLSMPSMPTLDPRELGVFDIQESLRSMLNNGTFTKIQSLSGNGSSGGGIQIELLDFHKRKVSILFDGQVGLMPTRITYYCTDGSRNIDTEIHYSKVDQNAFFVRTATSRIYQAGDCFDDSAASAYREKVTVTIKDLEINPSIDEHIFQLQLPKGTLVRDSIADKIYRVGEEDLSSHNAGWNKPRFATGVVAVVSVVIALTILFRAIWKRIPRVSK